MSPANELPESFLADQAVTTEPEDEFQRYPFAKQIASTIRNRRNTASLVLGLYGKWGSGKSSVLNFIATELASSNVITMVFNPWLFSGEEQLLLGFFSQLSELLAPLDSADARDTAQALAGYSKKIVYRLALFKLEATQEQVQSFKSVAALEEFKHKLSELLRLSNKRILIIIDDLDRLDKREVQAMLRLVKLTGDFELTTYLLAFDDAMVARAVGERYPGGGKAAGRRFLEKIIQVPLRLPVIQQEVMNRYFMKHLQNGLALTNTHLTEVELQRLNGALTGSILRLNINPRDVSRYTNTLMVVLPMLQGEVNVVDLVLIEALKMFYPSLYKLATTNQHAVTGILESSQLQDAHQRYDSLFGEKAANLGAAKALFFTLFPAISRLYREHRYFLGSDRRRTEDDLYREKSIASTYYFKRYFSYAVQEGEIPDESFRELLSHLQEQNVTQASELATEMIARSSDSELLRRLEAERSQVVPSEASVYCQLLVRISAYFSDASLGDRSFRLFPRVTSLLLSYFNQTPEQVRVSLGEYIIQESTFEFGYQLLFNIYRLRPWEKVPLAKEIEDIIAFFTPDYFNQLARIFLECALKKSNTQALYKVYGSESNFLFILWQRLEGTSVTDAYLQLKLDELPADLSLFLRYMSPAGSLNGIPTHNHLNKESYQVLSSIVSLDYIYQLAKHLIGDAPPLPYVGDIFSPPSDEERLHEFVYLHDNKGENPDVIEDANVIED